MKLSRVNDLPVKRKRSVLRTILIAVTFLPAWHLMCRDLFNLSATDAMGGTAFSSKSTLPYPSAVIDFAATAYCEKGITKSGVPVAEGIVAADEHVLPLGSWIQVDGPSPYSGIYHVMDTGRLVRGKKIDIYIPSLAKALKFGFQRVRITVLKYGPVRREPVPMVSD
jgi:3D (Asp-Asp-Asp) domain-containing protein